MGYLKPQETDLLKLPSNPEFWVRMRRSAPWGVRNNAQSKMVKFSASPASSALTNGKVEVISEAEWGSYIRALIKGFITEWNLTDEDERPLPITEENLDLLADEDGQFLASEAQARNKLRTPEQEKNLGRRSPPRSSTSRR